MNRCITLLKGAAVLFGIAVAALPGASAQQPDRPCPPPPLSSVLTLTAEPARLPVNLPTTVQYRLVAVGKGKVLSVRLSQNQGGRQTFVPMTAMGVGRLGLFSGRAVVTATTAQVINAVAEVAQQVGTGEFVEACMSRSNTVRLVVIAAPPQPVPDPLPDPVPDPPPRPLPLPRPAVETVTAKGISLSYPAGWQLNQAVVDEGGPLALNNFNSRYLTGGIAPKGGAEVDVTFTPKPQTTPQQALAQDLPDVKFLNSRQVTVDGSIGTEVWYHDDFGPGLVTTNAAVYVPRGRYLYKFFLSFHANDPNEKTFGVQFRQMLNSVKFKEPR